jgi:regulator of cell morphogenesis and NO signaling
MTSFPSTLGEMAVQHPAATRVFWRHKLDFCCGGQQSFTEACREAGLDEHAIADEIDREETRGDAPARWDERPLPELIDHIFVRYHEPLRRTLPVLVELARKVESRHADKATCPRGLAALLAEVESSVADHLAKEEQILFPLIKAGRGAQAQMPIRVMYQEHEDHGANLHKIRALTNDLQEPEEACESWRALYASLRELEAELQEHIHLENNVLFPRALQG